MGGNILRRFRSIITTEERVQKLEKEGTHILQEEIANIRQAFTAAKDKFLKIPDALKEMPKLDPKGHK